MHQVVTAIIILFPSPNCNKTWKNLEILAITSYLNYKLTTIHGTIILIFKPFPLTELALTSSAVDYSVQHYNILPKIFGTTGVEPRNREQQGRKERLLAIVLWPPVATNLSYMHEARDLTRVWAKIGECQLGYIKKPKSVTITIFRLPQEFICSPHEPQRTTGKA